PAHLQSRNRPVRHCVGRCPAWRSTHRPSRRLRAESHPPWSADETAATTIPARGVEGVREDPGRRAGYGSCPGFSPPARCPGAPAPSTLAGQPDSVRTWSRRTAAAWTLEPDATASALAG